MNKMSKMAVKEREFELTDSEFKKLTALIRNMTGIVLGEHKKEMLYSRLARRLRLLDMQSFSQYCALLDSPDAEQEVGFLVNAVTTNLTKFYRESHHFKSLEDHLRKIENCPTRKTSNKVVRIWSAGCSSGEEPYSIASIILDKVPSLSQWDVQILATDLDTNMLQKGREGVYRQSSMEVIPGEYKNTFDTITSLSKGSYNIAEKAKKLVHFKQLNLHHKWPMKRKYDAIFCRNVLIYFDAPTKDTLVRRYAEMLLPGGILFLGHSESLTAHIPGLNLIGRTSYVKEG